MDDLQVLLEELNAHDRVGASLDQHPERIFLSGWNGTHPYVTDMLGDLIERLGERTQLLTQYSHLDEDPDLVVELSALHQAYGEGLIEPTRFAPGAGSSAFLATLLHHVRRIGFDELCYLPPVYYNAIYWIRELQFRVRRVADEAPLDGRARLRLPNRRTCLWVTDPLWFAGMPLSDEIVAEIGAWQARTGSTVVVDGTFAYMEWEGPRPAGTASLDPDLTYRLVCPTKALALHGFRFAYAIVPSQAAHGFIEFHGRMHGATSLFDRVFAHRAVAVLAARMPAQTLWPYVRERLDAVLAVGTLRDAVRPAGGYFVFAAGSMGQRDAIGLGSACFTATGHADHLRVNLLDDAVVSYLLRPSATGGQ